MQFLGPGIIFMSAPVGFMYAWHVRRQFRNWRTMLALCWASVIGALLAVVFICGTIAMTMHYFS